MASKLDNFISNQWVVFSPCLFQLLSFGVYFLTVVTYWRRPAWMPELDALMQPSLILLFVIIPLLGVAHFVYGLVRYFQTRHRKYLLHITSFVLLAVLTLGAYFIISQGLYVTV